MDNLSQHFITFGFEKEAARDIQKGKDPEHIVVSLQFEKSPSGVQIRLMLNIKPGWFWVTYMDRQNNAQSVTAYYDGNDRVKFRNINEDEINDEAELTLWLES